MSDPQDHPGALPKGRLIGEYEIVRVLGAGGFGITYLAFDHQLDGPVAVKEYFPGELATRASGDRVAATVSANRETFAWGLDRFLDEARTVHRFRHRNVVQARRLLEANGTAYLVMEYVEGESLKTILDRRGSLSAEEWRPWMDALLEGLEHVHSHGYLHRDIKPANIVVRSEGAEPVLIDFGSARLQHRDRTHTQVLTAAYAPIEQHSTGAPQGPPTDIYALAATSYRALTGTPVSSAPDRVLNDDCEPLANLVAGAERQWLAAIDHGLAVRPENRPQTVDEWRAEFAGTAASRPTGERRSTAVGDVPQDSSTGLFETAEPAIGSGARSTPDSVDAPPRVAGRAEKGPSGPASTTAAVASGRSRSLPPRRPSRTSWRLARRWPAVAALGALVLFAAALSVVLLTEEPSRDGAAGNEPAVGPLASAIPADADTEEPPREDEAAPAASFRVAPEPSNARVELLNLDVPYVPGMSLPPGQYRVQVSAPGHRSSQTVIEHGANPTVQRVRLDPETATVVDSEVSSPNLPAGDENDAEVQSRLGDKHYHGDGTTQDYGAAVEWYREAADQGDAEAQFNLGLMYWNGHGVPLNREEAEAWFRKALDQGYAAAQRKAASQGDAAATFNLGVMYDLGAGVPQDHGQAGRWYRKAADQGYARAQYELGVRSEFPYRRRRRGFDFEEAAAWYRKAADQGHARAQYALGLLHANGEGVPQDDREAVAWYRKAADQGYAPAQRSLALKYSLGEGVAQDHGEAAAWYRKAAEPARGRVMPLYREAAKQGNADAQYNLGVLYASGEDVPQGAEGVPQGYVRAYAWWNIAAAQDHEPARRAVDRIGRQMTPEQITEAQRLSRDLISQ